MCRFNAKEAILDDMFTSAVMQTPSGKHLKEFHMNFMPFLSSYKSYTANIANMELLGEKENNKLCLHNNSIIKITHFCEL